TAANDFIGNIILNPSASLQIIEPGGPLDHFYNEAIPDGSSITFNSGSSFRISPGGANDYETVGTLISAAAGAGSVYLDNGSSVSGVAFALTIGADNRTGEYSGVITNISICPLGITKTGTGTQTLSGVNTYTGATTISNGTLTVNGSLAANTNPLTVQSAGTLAGLGTIGCAIAVNGTFAPGTNNAGTLTCGSDLTLNAGSTSTFGVNGSTLANSSVVVGGTATYGGTLNILPTGTFSAGQTFTLFSGAGAAGASSFANITGSPGAGLSFTFANGVLSVVNGSVTPVALTSSLSGNTLTLTWPAGQGWRLVGQTNQLSAGLNPDPAAWSPVSGVSDGSATITINATNPTVFYRLVNP
ncbi:MAG TPA: autotransporter-associated beta strand repeat-containing protein, partial [Verrucomicrobiae bacterium]